MHDLLTLQVKDGPQIGQDVPIPTDKMSLGGKGSGSDIELSGVPNGVQFAELKVVSGKWTIAEFKPKTILLNGKQLKRKNVLKSGDEIRLPSMKKGQSIRYKLDMVAQKKTKEEKDTSSGIKPLYLVMGVSYVIIMIMVGLYFVTSGSNDEVQEARLEIIDVTTALNNDIAAIDRTIPIQSENIALSDFAANFDELKKFVVSDIDNERKLKIENDFKKRIVQLFSEAWRLEQQERWFAAKEKYEKVVTLMADRHLATTVIALKRLSQLNLLRVIFPAACGVLWRDERLALF